ncbi:ligand-binding sensor domain-containing protein [Mesoterricola silvestris]|uniref:GGDEF domain-containing protein n=1 Tax=Mesoterricola silvestris TaxID=2927979 RepID=A0AA48KA67_9BACT|nr:two-component regulator propeller domain-containing protein [Mesoterricola silvestris]BDU73012.1 GGDEF domain-containing protein [Mesoterricola silvestris]
MGIREGLVAWVFCMVATAGPPEPGRLPFVMLGTDQGLSSGAVVCMAQDRDGFLWMGSENGLLRYEGGQSRQWTAEDGLPSASVGKLAACPDGGVWVATGRGLVRFREGRFETITVDGRPYVHSASDLALDRRGRLWAYTFDGLIRQKEGLAFESLDWTTPGTVYGIMAGPRSGSVYVAGQHGIQVFREDGGRVSWGAAQGLPPRGPLVVAEDGRGRVWAGAGSLLLMKGPESPRFQDESGRLKAAVSPNGQPYLDRDGSVWIPTQDGVQQMDGERLDTARGLPFRWVRSVFRDREGALWVMGPGLAHMLGRGRVLNHPLTVGESGEVVWYLTRDARGRMIAATDNGAVRMEAQGPVRIPGTEGTRIKGMAVDRAGTLWMVNTRGPTLWLRPGRPRAEVAPLGGLGFGANSVFVDAGGTVWIGGTRQGLLRFEARAGRLVVEVPPAFRGTGQLGVYEIHGDAQGGLWAGCDGGLLLRPRGGAWSFFAAAPGTRVRGLALLPDGTAWIHFEEPLGLAHVRPAEGALQVLERRTKGWGLGSNMVYAVRLDERGRLWASTDKGLDRVEPALHLGRRDGMVNEDCSISALRVEGDIVWVGTSGGLVRFDSAGAAAPAEAPRAFVMALEGSSRTLEPPFAALDPLPHGKATVEFRVAAPSYLQEQDLRFQVRLRGLEDTWREVEGRRVLFPALRGGRYRFEVRAAQGQGPFGPVAGVDFRVTRPWWRTGWAYTLAALAGALAVAALVRLRNAALRRRSEALEALVATRTRELSQRNTELSEALGKVKQLSGLLPICAHCKKIRDDQGYWNQLEQYLSRHAEVGFSHGICPDCAAQMFPDLVKRRAERGG